MLSRSFSIYLDLIRFVAALLVLFYHSNFKELTANTAPFSNYGHSAVIVFFVLSGYVIAYVTDTKEKTFKKYALSRMARIYSVAIPVLILTPLLDMGGELLNPEFYVDKATHDYWYIRIISSLFFLNEIWFVSIMSFSNVPYWSLCYEVWYYALFAAGSFINGKKKWILITLLCLLIGPKILLLFPLWYLGVWMYRSGFLANIRPLYGFFTWIVTLVLIIAFHSLNIQFLFSGWLNEITGDELFKQLTFSKYFLSDYLFAPLIALNFLSAKSFCEAIEGSVLKVKPIICYLASYTFIMYLIHQPLLQFFSALISGNPNDRIFYIHVMVCVLASVWLLGHLTENQKTGWKTLVTKIWDAAELRFQQR